MSSRMLETRLILINDNTSRCLFLFTFLSTLYHCMCCYFTNYIYVLFYQTSFLVYFSFYHHKTKYLRLLITMRIASRSFYLSWTNILEQQTSV